MLSYFTFCLQGVFPCAQWRQLPHDWQHRASLIARGNTSVLFSLHATAGSSSPMAAFPPLPTVIPAARYRRTCSRSRGAAFPGSQPC